MKMKKLLLSILLFLGIAITVYASENKKYISVNFGEGNSVSLWCDKDTEDDLFSFSYDGLDWKCTENGRIVYCKKGDSELFFDEKGNNYFSKIPDLEMWNDFDSKGNIIHSVTDKGDEVWYEYSNRNLIHSFDTLGFESFYEYDSKGRLTYIKTISPNGFVERVYEYNVILSSGESKTEFSSSGSSLGDIYSYLMNSVTGYRVTITSSYGEQFYEEYSSDGELHRRYDSSSDIYFKEDGSILNKTVIDGVGNEKIYDSEGELVLKRDAFNIMGTTSYKETKFEYYPNGNIKTSISRDIASDKIKEYDMNGNLIHSYNLSPQFKTKSNEVFYEYNSENLVTYKKEIIGEKISEYWYDSDGNEIKTKTSKQ